MEPQNATTGPETGPDDAEAADAVASLQGWLDGTAESVDLPLHVDTLVSWATARLP